MTITFNNKMFDLLSSFNGIVDLTNAREINATTWDLANNGFIDAYSERQLQGATPATHVAIARRDDDQSGWCDVEQKWEYLYMDTYIIIPRADVEQLFEFEDKAADLGFKDYV